MCNDDYIHFGTSLRSTPRGGEVSAVADTGCQSCLIGSKVVHYLGFRDRDLLGVEHRMNAVNQHSIDISGTVILRLTGLDKGGHQLQTTQICYVTPDTDKLYLSREACVDLGLISSSFPTFGEALSVTAVDKHVRMSCPVKDIQSVIIMMENNATVLKRSMSPPLPTTIPFPATEVNAEKLKQ